MSLYRVCEPQANKVRADVRLDQPNAQPYVSSEPSTEENSIIRQMLELGLFNPPPLPQKEQDAIATSQRKQARAVRARAKAKKA